MKMTNDVRVEKHVISSSHSKYKLLMDFCHKSKNLYNHANYIIRQEFVSNGKWIRYAELDKLLKADVEYPDYRQMPTAQSAQQILRVIDKNWKSFFKSIKDWSKDKEKYLGKPKMPKYLNKSGNYLLALTNQECKIKDGYICFPKIFECFKIKPKFLEKDNFSSFQQVRFIPRGNKIIVELVYNVQEVVQKPNNDRYVGVDLGINNLSTVCNNVNLQPFVINGKPLKSANQFYNKRISHLREVCKRMNGKDYSKAMSSLTEKRNAKVDDYMHKASRLLVNYCLENDINTIVVGQNKEWKQNIAIGRKNNQNFVSIPFARLVQMIQYKANECGVAVVLTEESYTSGTSFIDNELPVMENYNKARRVSRGMFKSNNGTLINADLNGAYQILKKVAPIKWSRGCALHPVVVNVA